MVNLEARTYTQSSLAITAPENCGFTCPFPIDISSAWVMLQTQQLRDSFLSILSGVMYSGKCLWVSRLVDMTDGSSASVATCWLPDYNRYLMILSRNWSGFVSAMPNFLCRMKALTIIMLNRCRNNLRYHFMDFLSTEWVHMYWSNKSTPDKTEDKALEISFKSQLQLLM